MSVEDIKKAYTLFFDEARSVQFLQEYSKEFLFNEEEDEDDDDDDEEASEADKGKEESGDKMETS